MTEVWLGLLLGGACIAVTWRTRDLFNPVNIVSVGFFANLILARLKLTPLQRVTWAPETEAVLLQAWLLWLLYPTLVLLLAPRPRRWLVERLASKSFSHQWLARATALLVIGLFLLENTIESGVPLPMLRPEIDVHVATTPGLGLMISSLSAAVTLVLVVAYARHRSRWDLMLTVVLVALPLTRLGRLEMVTSLVAALTLYYYLAIRSTWRYTLALTLAVAVLVPALLGVSYYRGSQGGVYIFTYSRDFAFNSSGPLVEAGAYYYGYMVLGFDSLDGLVRGTTRADRTFGAYTLRPLTLGALRLHNFVDDYPMGQYLAERSDPALRAEVIATALSYFYLDFGAELIAVPLFLYMSLILAVYLLKRDSVILTAAYCLMAGALALTSFTDLLSGVSLYYGIIFCSLILGINLSAFRISRTRGLVAILR